MALGTLLLTVLLNGGLNHMVCLDLFLFLRGVVCWYRFGALNGVVVTAPFEGLVANGCRFAEYFFTG